MKSALLACACATALFPAFAADAQDAPAQRPLIGGHGNNVEAFIAQYDDNADGRLTWAEFDAFRRKRFDATDANGDGTVDVEEYVQEFDDRSRQALEQAREAQVRQTHTRFAAIDADKDGRVSRAEFDASGERVFAEGAKKLAERPAAGKPADGASAEGRTEANAARFDRDSNPLGLPSSHTAGGFLELYDGNGDGKVERDEFDRERAAQFARTDVDGDGVLSEDEYLAEFEDRLDRRIATLGGGSDKQTRIRFDALDTDKDGRMTFAEYQASGKRTFDMADRNHDGVVDAEDAKLPPPPRPQRADGAAAPAAKPGN
ncbi:MAG: EF-hand domain-containing protein [Pseudoxanthomonas sp.]